MSSKALPAAGKSRSSYALAATDNFERVEGAMLIAFYVLLVTAAWYSH